jgi:hypothetical protein
VVVVVVGAVMVYRMGTLGYHAAVHLSRFIYLFIWTSPGWLKKGTRGANNANNANPKNILNEMNINKSQGIQLGFAQYSFNDSN